MHYVSEARIKSRKVAFEIDNVAKTRSMKSVVGLPMLSSDKGVHRSVTLWPRRSPPPVIHDARRRRHGPVLTLNLILTCAFFDCSVLGADDKAHWMSFGHHFHKLIYDPTDQNVKVSIFRCAGERCKHCRGATRPHTYSVSHPVSLPVPPPFDALDPRTTSQTTARCSTTTFSCRSGARGRASSAAPFPSSRRTPTRGALTLQGSLRSLSRLHTLHQRSRFSILSVTSTACSPLPRQEPH